MSRDRKLLNNDSDEDISEVDHLPSILSFINGYCKVNLEVPQVNLFYSENCLLPINAKVNSNILNNNIQNMQTKKINDEDIDSIWKCVPLNKNITEEYQRYSKPSYAESILNRNLFSKDKKKLNNMADNDSLFDNEEDTASLYSDQNVPREHNKELDSYAVGLQEPQISQPKKRTNYTHLSLLEKYKNTLKQQNENSSKSECPLCFQFYPSQDIEAHASGCSIEE